MTDLHQLLEDWLVEGAAGDPPREVAVHAAVCDSCLAKLGAFDALGKVEVALAGPPPAMRPRSLVMRVAAGTRVGAAVAGTVITAVVVVALGSQVLGALVPEGPEQEVAAATGTPAQTAQPGSPEAGTVTIGPVPAEEPAPSLAPSATPRASTPVYTYSYPPVPHSTPRPSAPGATPGPTPTPAPTPAPECSDGLDNDGDGYTDYPNDPACLSPTQNDESPFNFHECNNNIDDDQDGYTDLGDPGCGGDPYGNSELPINYQCSDGIDNEALPDGLIDFPADPECTDATDNDESL